MVVGQVATLDSVRLTHSPCFCSGCSQTAVANIMATEGRSVIIKLLKVHHLLYLGADGQNGVTQKCDSQHDEHLDDGVYYPTTDQVLIRFVLKGELSPPDEGNLGEDVSLQQLSEQHPARLPGSAEDETAFILLPEVFLQGLRVLSHAACGRHNKLTPLLAPCMIASNTKIRPKKKRRVFCAGNV